MLRLQGQGQGQGAWGQQGNAQQNQPGYTPLYGKWALGLASKGN